MPNASIPNITSGVLRIEIVSSNLLGGWAWHAAYVWQIHIRGRGDPLNRQALSFANRDLNGTLTAFHTAGPSRSNDTRFTRHLPKEVDFLWLGNLPTAASSPMCVEDNSNALLSFRYSWVEDYDWEGLHNSTNATSA